MFIAAQSVAALSLAALLFADGTHTSGPTSGDILENLDSAQRIIGVSGGSLRHEGSGFLEEGEDIGFSVRLTPGAVYRVIAVCDRDCSDLDIWGEDDRGEVLGGDFEPRAFAMMLVVGPPSGAVTLNASMAACSIAPCAYGYRVYEDVGGGSGW